MTGKFTLQPNCRVMALSGGPASAPPPGRRAIRIILGIFIAISLVLFAVGVLDRLIPSPQPATATDGIFAQLDRHAVKRVTIPAPTILVELYSGETMRTVAPAGADLWPAIARSRAAVSIIAEPPATGAVRVVGMILQSIPLLIFGTIVAIAIVLFRTLAPR